MSSVSRIQLETALTVDALTHLDKAIRGMQQERGFYRVDDPPALCFMNTKADYEGMAWSSGDALRESLIKVLEFYFFLRTPYLECYTLLNHQKPFLYLCTITLFTRCIDYVYNILCDTHSLHQQMFYTRTCKYTIIVFGM